MAAHRAAGVVAVLAAVVLLAAACGPSTPGAGPPPGAAPPAPATTVTAPPGGTTLRPGAPDPYATSGLGEFVARCTFSHRLAADPIVAPGDASFWHLHDFFGNRSADHASTDASLLGRPTSCDPAADAAAYWVPTVLHHGTPVPPSQITVYYQVERPQDPAKVQTWPTGLRIIAGKASTTTAQPDHVAQWGCIGTSVSSPTIPDCGGAELQLILSFPDCWDGVRLDSADHASHLAYSRGRDCPTTHPVLTPKLQFRMRWPVSGPGVSLSSDAAHGSHPARPPGLTAHGDVINTWDAGEFDRRVLTCLRAARVCDAAGTVIR